MSADLDHSAQISEMQRILQKIHDRKPTTHAEGGFIRQMRIGVLEHFAGHSVRVPPPTL